MCVGFATPELAVAGTTVKTVGIGGGILVRLEGPAAVVAVVVVVVVLLLCGGGGGGGGGGLPFSDPPSALSNSSAGLHHHLIHLVPQNSHSAGGLACVACWCVTTGSCVLVLD